MRKLETNEIKEIGLETLKRFDELMNQYNIKYSLYAGSLLGAVRHNGYIPWDDDIDVCMLRSDYDKLINIVKNNNNDNRYKFLFHENNKEYNYPFGKFIDIHTLVIEKDVDRNTSLGIYIDIFPFDDILGNNYKEACQNIKKLSKYTSYIGNCLFCKPQVLTNNIIINLIKTFRHFLIRLFNMDFYYKRLMKIVSNQKSKKYCGILIWVWGTRLIYEKSKLKDIILHKFEKYSFPIFKNYDYMLKIQFGDYMKLPPENKRTFHYAEAYMK